MIRYFANLVFTNPHFFYQVCCLPLNEYFLENQNIQKNAKIFSQKKVKKFVNNTAEIGMIFVTI